MFRLNVSGFIQSFKQLDCLKITSLTRTRNQIFASRCDVFVSGSSNVSKELGWRGKRKTLPSDLNAANNAGLWGAAE